MLTPRRHFKDAHKNNQTMIFEGKQHTMGKKLLYVRKKYYMSFPLKQPSHFIKK